MQHPGGVCAGARLGECNRAQQFALDHAARVFFFLPYAIPSKPFFLGCFTVSAVRPLPVWAASPSVLANERYIVRSPGRLKSLPAPLSTKNTCGKTVVFPRKKPSELIIPAIQLYYCIIMIIDSRRNPGRFFCQAYPHARACVTADADDILDRLFHSPIPA